MSQWRLEIVFTWPDELPVARLGGKDRPKTLQDILFEMLEPLNRDNVDWYDARFALERDPDGGY